MSDDKQGSDTIICPVCSVGDVAKDAVTCPNCETDLLPILRVREIVSGELAEAYRLCEIGALEAALQHAAAAVSLDPLSLEARKALGRIYWQLGDHQVSLRHWEEAKRLAANDAEAGEWVANGRRAIRVRSWTQIGLVVAFSALFAALVGVLVYLPLQSVRKDLGAVDAAIKKFEDYQKSHAWSNAEVSRMSELLQRAEKTVSVQKQEIVNYRSKHSRLASNFENLSRRLTEVERERDATIKLLNEYRSSDK